MDERIIRLAGANRRYLSRHATSARLSQLEDAYDEVQRRVLTLEAQQPLPLDCVQQLDGQQLLVVPDLEIAILELLQGKQRQRFSVTPGGDCFPNFTKGCHQQPVRINVTPASALLALAGLMLIRHRERRGGRMLFSAKDFRCADCRGHYLNLNSLHEWSSLDAASPVCDGTICWP